MRVIMVNRLEDYKILISGGGGDPREDGQWSSAKVINVGNVERET